MTTEARVRESGSLRLVLAVFELLGLGRVYAWFARIACDAEVTRRLQLRLGLSARRLQTLSKDAQYYFIANLIRVGLYVPLVVEYTAQGLHVPLAFLLVLIGLHLLSMALETYRWLLIRVSPVTPEEDDPSVWDPPKTQAHPLAERYFRPKRFENERFYQLIGVGFVRWVVLHVVALSRGEHGGSKGPKVEYLGGANLENLERFQHNTRVGEVLHFFGVLMNVVPTLSLLAIGELWWALFAFCILLADLGMGLLQRQHRARIWRLLVRLRTRASRGLT